MDFFQSRVGFEATYYNRQIKDDIVRTSVSSTTGYSTAVLNVGRLKNSGIEILLRGTPVKNRNLTWDIIATFTKNDNKIVALGDGVKVFLLFWQHQKAGMLLLG